MKPIFIISLFLFFLVGVAFAAIPAAAQKEIDQLVQQDKFTAALAKVDALLKDQPADKDLLDLKAQLEKSARPAAAPAPAITDEDRLEMNVLNRLITKIRESSDADERKKLQEQVLENSEALVKKYPQEMRLWLMRAAAALALDKPREGWEAGKNLKALGALSSADESVGNVMADLKLKKWLVDDYAAVEKAKVDAEAAREADRLKFLSGQWGCKYAFESQYQSGGFTEQTFSLKVEGRSITSVKLEWHSTGVSTKTGEKNIHDEVWIAPGDYSMSFKSGSLRQYGRGKNVLKTAKLSNNGDFLELRIAGTHTEGGTLMTEEQESVDKLSLFLIDHENARLITITKDELREDPKDLLARFRSAESSDKRQVFTRQ